MLVESIYRFTLNLFHARHRLYRRAIHRPIANAELEFRESDAGSSWKTNSLESLKGNNNLHQTHVTCDCRVTFKDCDVYEGRFTGAWNSWEWRDYVVTKPGKVRESGYCHSRRMCVMMYHHKQ